MKAKTGMVVVFLVSFLIMGVSMSYADPAHSQGYPAVSFLSSPSLNIGVVGKYEASSFTQAEAQNMSEEVAALVSLVLGTTLGTESTLALTVHYTPNEMVALGLPDADGTAAYALANYKSYGLQGYVFLDVSRTAAVAGSGMGNNIRVNVWVGDPASLGINLSSLGVTGNYLYVTSLEIPERYLQFAFAL